MATQYDKAMVSEVSIANQALGFLGANPINSFSDRSTSAQLMRDNYPFIRDAVLTDVTWSFTTIEAISVTADKSPWGLQYAHQVPLEWLTVLRVFRDATTSPKLRSEGWTRQGNTILTDEATVYMWGQKRVTDTALFSPGFVQLLATRLAADLCMAITENTNRETTLYQVYAAKLSDAKMSDGIQGGNEVIISNNLIDARTGYVLS